MTMNYFRRFLDFLCPRHCVVCGKVLSPTEQSLCGVCLLHLPRTTFQFTPDDNAVAQLFWGQLPVERAAALMYYEPRSELAQLLYQLKYNQRPDIGEDVGRIMAQEMQMAHFFDGIDVLVPVPLSRKRLRQRGYNQSEMLARGIREITHLPIDTRAVRREHFRKSQTFLTRQERRENVEGIFRLRRAKRLEGRHVLLIDDVCTTGATLIACGEAIRHVPGIRISILTLAYTKR